MEATEQTFTLQSVKILMKCNTAELYDSRTRLLSGSGECPVAQQFSTEGLQPPREL